MEHGASLERGNARKGVDDGAIGILTEWWTRAICLGDRVVSVVSKESQESGICEEGSKHGGLLETAVRTLRTQGWSSMFLAVWRFVVGRTIPLKASFQSALVLVCLVPLKDAVQRRMPGA